jgi:hypothetical protein
MVRRIAAAGQLKIKNDQILCGINERNNSWLIVTT